MWCGIDKNVYFVYLKWRALYIFIKFTCSGSEFESLISLLIFCLIEFKSRIWVLGSLALIVALILLPLYLCCFKIYFIRYENCNSCFFCSNPPHPFILSLCVSLHVRWVWMQHTNGFWLYLLIGGFSQFKFRITASWC